MQTCNGDDEADMTVEADSKDDGETKKMDGDREQIDGCECGKRKLRQNRGNKEWRLTIFEDISEGQHNKQQND